jgi:Ca2+-transporting ATPase
MDLSPKALVSLMEDDDLRTLNEFGTVSDIARLLESDTESGISSTASIRSRVHRYGSNILPDRPVRSFFEMLVEALSDQTLLILVGCAIFNLVLEIVFASTDERSTAWIDGAAILMAVAIVSLVQASSNHRQELQFAAINRIKSIYDVKVIRSGKLMKILNTELVVGDVCLLEAGDRVPADGLLIWGDELRIDESVTSGESEAVLKTIQSDPFVIGGTHVVEGRGTFLVICVGLNTRNGKVFALLDTRQKATPLQEKLEVLATQIGYVGMAAAVITFAALFVGWLVIRIRVGWSFAAWKEVLTYLIDSLTIVVVAVPEGLPLAVTISLAYSMYKMMADKNFVRRLSACETMGNATVICTDKTGTLTMNEMNVELVAIGDEILPISALLAEASDNFTEALVRAISVNTTAVIGDDGGCIGSQTECALLRLVQALDCDYSEIRWRFPSSKVMPFDQTQKTMTTIVNGRTYIKGAPDVLLPNCTSSMDRAGCLHPLNDSTRETIMRRVQDLCSRAFRTLAICDDGILLTVVAIRDTLRPTTSQAILKCQRAGIRVVMITGDHVQTAQAIARECGIASPLSSALTGSELRAMSPDKVYEAVADVSVIARSTPVDKHAVVSALQRRGEIVAVTGDGTNDVAALMQADVGLAMGKSGTELAKEASDIVVLDDNFESIVAAVLWGRCIYNNVRRFLQFQLTANVVTLFISIMSAVIIHDTPFKAVQLLWVNLIMDSLGALALATGRPHASLLNRPPQRRTAPLISSFMIQNIAGQTLFQIAVVALILAFPSGIEPRSEHHYTLLLNVFVYCQMFNLINARVVDLADSVVAGIMDNALFIGIMCGIGVAEFCLVQFCGQFFSCVPLSLKEQALSIALASLCVPWGFCVRKCPRTVLVRAERALGRIRNRFLKKTDARA